MGRLKLKQYLMGESWVRVLVAVLFCCRRRRGVGNASLLMRFPRHAAISRSEPPSSHCNRANFMSEQLRAWAIWALPLSERKKAPSRMQSYSRLLGLELVGLPPPCFRDLWSWCSRLNMAATWCASLKTEHILLYSPVYPYIWSSPAGIRASATSQHMVLVGGLTWLSSQSF